MDYNNYNNNENSGDGNTYNNFYKSPDETGANNEAPGKKDGFFGKLIKAVVLGIVSICVAIASFVGVSQTLERVQSISPEDEISDTDLVEESDTEDVAENASDDSETEGESIEIMAATNVSDVAANAMPSIVAITNIGTYTYENFFGISQSYESQSAGSGIIMGYDDEKLYIATNNHVVSNAETLTVTFIDDTQVSAEVRGTDSSTDLAVISVDMDSITDETKGKIRTAVFADSSDLKQGEFVIAIGNALGYGQSVTTGIVSALDREVTVSDDTTGTTVTNSLIQTDAAINPGNSGGALLNTNGEVIGINSVKTSDTAVEGMGYAIPSATALSILEELMTREKVEESEAGYLGVSGVDVTSDVADTYSMPQGVYISRIVSGSAAEEAGLQQGDIITGFAGRSITAMEEIQDLLQYYAKGTTVEVVVQRSINGSYEEMTFSVTLGSK